MYKLYGWHYYILLLSAIIFVLLCHDFLAWMGSRILTKNMRRRAGARCHVCATGKGCPRAPMEQYWVGGGAEHTRADRSHRKSVCGPGTVPGVKHAQRSCNIPEHSSEASTGLRHAERSWNIPRKLTKTQACRTFLEHSGTFLGRTESDAHIPYCIFVPYRSGPIRSRPLCYFIFFFTFDSSLVFCFLFTESAIPGRQHHIPSDL